MFSDAGPLISAKGPGEAPAAPEGPPQRACGALAPREARGGLRPARGQKSEARKQMKVGARAADSRGLRQRQKVAA